MNLLTHFVVESTHFSKEPSLKYPGAQLLVFEIHFFLVPSSKNPLKHLPHNWVLGAFSVNSQFYI